MDFYEQVLVLLREMRDDIRAIRIAVTAPATVVVSDNLRVSELTPGTGDWIELPHRGKTQ